MVKFSYVYAKYTIIIINKTKLKDVIWEQGENFRRKKNKLFQGNTDNSRTISGIPGFPEPPIKFQDPGTTRESVLYYIFVNRSPK